MKKKNELNILEVSLCGGAIGVLMTDTMYGLVGSAKSKKVVERIYNVRSRDAKKPMIILIGSIDDLKLFGVKPSEGMLAVLKKLWPGPVSIILPCKSKRFEYLHRGTHSLAFRLPKNAKLRGFLKRTGPLVAPSANPEGKKPAKTIKEAEKYFGGNIDFYIDSGAQKGAPSTIVQILR